MSGDKLGGNSTLPHCTGRLGNPDLVSPQSCPAVGFPWWLYPWVPSLCPCPCPATCLLVLGPHTTLLLGCHCAVYILLQLHCTPLLLQHCTLDLLILLFRLSCLPPPLLSLPCTGELGTPHTRVLVSGGGGQA